MNRTMIEGLAERIGEEVKVCGWTQAIRNQKKMQFLVLRDRSGLAQAVNERQGDRIEEVINGLTPESAVIVTGQVVANPQVKIGGLEIVVKNIEVTSLAETPLPIDENTAMDGRLDWRFLDLRRPKNLLIFEVQTVFEHALREYWEKMGFVEIHSPKFMGGASESGAELFRVDYFGGDAYLAQSPQFYKQMAMAAGFDRVFEIGPVFRANPSMTSRHDTEFTSVDVEIAWIDSHHDVMGFEAGWIQYAMQRVKEICGEKIQRLCGLEVEVPTLPFPKVTMKEAHAILGRMGHEVAREGGDLDPQGERMLAQYIREKHGHDFVFVIDYPITVRPFYHMRYPDAPDTTKSFDLIYRGLEVTTGAQREHRHDILLKQVIEKGVPPESIQYYLDFFRYGCPPHGGYGFGLTRLLMRLLGFENVREVTYLYRGINRLSP